MNKQCADKLDIKEMLTIYPYIAQKIREIHKDIIEYEELMAEARQGVVKAQILSDMPRGSDVGNPTQSYALQMIDDFGMQIQEYKQDVERLRDIKRWGDKLRRELTGRDWELLYLAYAQHKSNYVIEKRLRIKRNNVDNAILETVERARKLIN